MIIEINDLIQFYSGKKKLYGFITKDKVVTGSGEFIEVRNAIDPDDSHTITESDIINNYGQSPNLDELKIEVYNKEFVTSTFGVVTPYKTLLDAEEKCIKTALSEIEDSVKDFDIFPTRIFIKYNKGKKVGLYKFNKKEEVSEITLMPEAFDKNNIKEIMYHEIGHAVWDKLISGKLKAAWIKLYDKNMERKKVATQEVINLKTDFINSGMTVSEYVKNMEDGETMKKVAKYIKELYNLQPKHIDILVKSDPTSLDKYWPQDGLELSEYNPFVSQYATTSVEEFFSESFMYYYMKQQLPHSVEGAIEKSLQFIGVSTN